MTHHTLLAQRAKMPPAEESASEWRGGTRVPWGGVNTLCHLCHNLNHYRVSGKLRHLRGAILFIR